MLILRMIGIFIVGVLLIALIIFSFNNILFFILYIVGIFIAGVPFWVLFKTIKKKFFKMEQLGRAMFWYAILIFTIPWIGWIYNLINIALLTKSPLNIVAVKNIHYIRHPFVFVFSGVALAYLISSIGISKFKNWGRALGILIVMLVILVSVGFLGISLSGVIFGESERDVMMYPYLLFVIGPLVLFLLLCPNLLLLYCLTRPLKPTGDN